MTFMFKANQMFLIFFFMIRRFVHVYDNLNIVLNLDPGFECFCAKCAQFQK